MSDKTDTMPKPMDDTISEQAVGAAMPNHKRTCYAIRTLLVEVLDVFPETPTEFSNFNGRNVALAVAFDLTSLDTVEADDLTLVLRLLDHDDRVESVVAEDSQVLVSMKNQPRTYDNVESFNILDALDVMDEPVDYMGGSL